MPVYWPTENVAADFVDYVTVGARWSHHNGLAELVARFGSGLGSWAMFSAM
jgi:hypothetical protein